MQENRIKLTWYGTASVRITAGASQILIDPFFPLPDSHIHVPPDAYTGCRDILITHGHYDHIGSLHDIVSGDTAIYCTKAPYTSLLKKGVRKQNLRIITAESVLSFGDIKITAFKGSHIKLSLLDGLKAVFCKRVWLNRKGIIGKIRLFTSCREKKESLCYLVEAYGKRILILGSLSLAKNSAYPLGVDLALFPYQGSDQLCSIAKRIFQTIRPKAVLLTHFDDTFPPFSTEIDTTDFEHYLKNCAVVLKLNHGESLEI